MKKTRFLAGLLCIMMVLTMVPMMASAAVADSLYDQIGGLMGRNSSRAVNDATWLSMNFDFTDNFSQTDSITMPEGASYDNTNGLNMPKGTYSTWTYFPSTLASQGWTPLVFGAYYLRFKLDEAGKLEAQACAYYNNARSFIIMSPTGVTVFTSSDNATIGSGMASVTNLVDYAPGTDWNDMVVVANGGSANSANGYSVYMKKDTDTEFTKVASTGSYRSNGGWKSTGLTLSGNDSYVSDAVMLEGSDEKLYVPPVPAPEVPYTAVGEVLGYESSEVHPGVENTWGAMDVDFTAENVASTEGLVIGDGITFDTTYGATVPAGTGVNLNYSAPVKYQNKWSPMFLGTMGFSFKMTDTGAINASACTGWDANRVFMDITKDGITFAGSTNTIDNAFVPGTDWNDLLVVMGSTVGATDVAYYVYAKKATDTEFTKIATVTVARTGGGGLLNAGQGAVFYGQGFSMGYLKSFQASGNLLPGNIDETPNPGITDGLKTAIGKTLGATYISAKPATSSSDWPAMNLDFSGSFDSTQDGVNTGSGITYDATNGVIFPATDAVFKYRPTCNYNGWSPLCISGNYSFSFKLNADGQLIQESPQVWANNRTYIDITPKKVVIYDGGEEGGSQRAVTNLVDYEPGIAWNDVLVTTNTTGGYTVYMKKATDADFTKVAETTNYRVGGGAWGSTGFATTARSAMLAHAVSWIGVTPTYNSIEEIMGGNVATTYAFDFDSNFDDTSWKRQGSLTSPDGITYTDENGLDMSTVTATDATWNYNAYSGWSPFSAMTPWNAADYTPQAVYFKVKGNMNVQFRGPGNVGRFYLQLAPNSNIGSGTTETLAYDNPIKTDADWMEYLVVPKAESTTAGFTLYVKGGTTGGVWTKRSEANGWRSGGGNTTGFNLYAAGGGAGGQVKSIRTYILGVEDAVTAPATAEVAWFEDDMKDAEAYGNVSSQATCAEGVANFVANTETGSKKYALSDVEIPVGGYAEFKARSNGNYSVAFGDGTNGGSISVNKDYGEVCSTGIGYFAESNNVWRTFRIVRTEEGYSVYSKIDGASAWFEHVTKASKESTTKGITMTFQIHADGASASNGQVDYLKIYGPAPDGELVLTDGMSNLVVDGTAVLKYANPRAFVQKGDAAKTLIFAEYNNDDILVNAEYAEIEAGTGTVSVPYTFTDKANMVRVFYWDGETQANLNLDSTFVVE